MRLPLFMTAHRHMDLKLSGMPVRAFASLSELTKPADWPYDGPALASSERVRRHPCRRARSMPDRNQAASPTVPALVTART